MSTKQYNDIIVEITGQVGTIKVSAMSLNV